MARTSDLWETGPGGTYIYTIAPSGYNILINGTSKYLNFDTVVGTTGYGVRDNNGVMEFKNSGGAWGTLATGGAGGWGAITGTITTQTDLMDNFLYKGGILNGQTAIGGTAVTDILKLQGTSGNGTLTSPAIQLLTGNNGATVAMTVLNNGNVGVGTTTPGFSLSVVGNQNLGDTFTTMAHFGSGTNSNNSGAKLVLSYFPGDRAGFIQGGRGATGNGVLSLGTRASNIDTTVLTLDASNVGIGTTGPTATLHLKASTATANTASLKIDAGVVATTPVTGNIESDGTHLYWTDSGGTRRQLDN